MWKRRGEGRGERGVGGAGNRRGMLCWWIGRGKPQEGVRGREDKRRGSRKKLQGGRGQTRATVEANVSCERRKAWWVCASYLRTPLSVTCHGCFNCVGVHEKKAHVLCGVSKLTLRRFLEICSPKRLQALRVWERTFAGPNAVFWNASFLVVTVCALLGMEVVRHVAGLWGGKLLEVRGLGIAESLSGVAWLWWACVSGRRWRRLRWRMCVPQRCSQAAVRMRVCAWEKSARLQRNEKPVRWRSWQRQQPGP